MILAAAFILASLQGTVEERVGSALETSFRSAPESLRRESRARLSALFRSSPSPARVLDALPEEARRHARRVDSHREALGWRPGLEAKFAEGYALRLAALEESVRKALGRSTSPETRSTQHRQIDTLASVAREALSSRLPGPTGEALVDRMLDSFKTTRKASLDLPFDGFLPAPLSPSDLDAVLESIRAKVGRNPAAALATGDHDVPAVGRILEDLHGAFQEATGRASGEAPLERQAQDWEHEMHYRLELPGCFLPP